MGVCIDVERSRDLLMTSPYLGELGHSVHLKSPGGGPLCSNRVCKLFFQFLGVLFFVPKI